MSHSILSQQVRDFLAAHINSVVELEALLLLHAGAGRPWTAKALAERLRIEPAWLEEQLRELCARGLLECTTQEPAEYRYHAQRPELHEAVTELAAAYTDLRVQIISLIYSKPSDKIQVFADAFRIRKDTSGG